MFAEELKGNASKKRQEEARQRRRKLKQQQQKSAARSTQTASAIAKEGGDEKKTVSDKDVSAAQAVPATASQKPASSAVEIALQQRQLRQEAQLRQSSATTIQSIFRAVKSNQTLVQKEREILKQRLTDLSTLRTLLTKAGKSPVYVPPPATATSMIRQMLFLTRLIPFQRIDDFEEVLVRSTADLDFLKNMIEHVIMPGIKAKDGELDPILPWFESPEGRIRFLRLLRLCLAVATTRSIVPSTLTPIVIFLCSILGIPSPDNQFCIRDTIVKIARAMLLPIYSPVAEASKSVRSSSKVGAMKQNALLGPSLDLIQILRRHLLFNTGSGAIPPNAESMRQSCIPAKERTHADIIFHLCVDAVLAAPAGSEARRLQIRLVAEILTIPLLSWKLSAKSISKLLSSPPVTGGSRRSLSSRRPELLIVFMSAFVEHHSSSLSMGKIVSLLPKFDVPLATCPAPPVQCLLANLIQIGRICPSINGSDSSKIDYQAGAFFFNFIATVIDAVPLGTFISRESAIEWVSDGSSHTPVVLSPVIIQQCKLLLVDPFVRDLFSCAVDKGALDTDRVLREKNEKDLKHEKQLAEASGSSAASLAAKEARVNRTKSFWQSSKWARKLSQGVNKILSGESGSEHRKSASKVKGSGSLLNTSSVSRKLARGKGDDGDVIKAAPVSEELNKKDSESESDERPTYSPVLLFALCRAYGIILARWGGGGKDDIVKRVTGYTREGRMEEKKEIATASADPCTLSLLNVISFSSETLQALWCIIQSNATVVSNVYSVIGPKKSNSPIRSLKIRPHYSESDLQSKVDSDIGAAALFFFLSIFSHVLIVTDDCEIHDMDRPLPLHQLRRCIQLLKKLLYRACCLDDVSAEDGAAESNYFGLSLIASSSRTMRDLYDRSSRRPLAVPKLYVVDDLLEKELRKCKKHDDYVALLSIPVLRVCPFLVSFKRRLRVFERIVTTSRVEIQGSNEGYNLKPGIPVRITRGRVLEDGLLTLNKLGKDLRRRISVQYINEAGAQESGVDVGGLFKEFWADLSAIAFDPNWALFKATEGAGNCLYPNPASGAAHGSDHILLFEFLGRILGKALYEGITIHPQFAHFFLSFLRGDYNFLHMLSDLSTIDPQLYNNLMFLKNYDGDAEDLYLTFTVANNDFGGNKEVNLIPNGADVMVTNMNKQRYIGLVAKHHVCDRLREQSIAFTRGLWEVIDGSWLRLFNEPELQVLISGSSDGKIDIEDMRSNTRYVGGYTGIDRTVNRFWNVVGSLSSKQQGDLLRFVTSCERPPPLGFASMNPPFTIQRVGILRDGDKLPSASTCFNTLKLPTYSSEKILKQRLVYAIESGAGFEMT